MASTADTELTDAQALALLEDVRKRGGNRFLKPGFKRELTRATVSLLVRSWIDGVLLTSGCRILDPHGTLDRHSNGMIGVCWHHRLLAMLMGFRHRYARSWVRWRAFAMISASEDGELIARIFRDSGGSCIRGSASRGAADAIRAARTELEHGGQVFLTPDGPRGPARSVKDGAAELARASGLPVVPISANYGRALRFEGAWDRFEVPLPFGRFTLVVGEAIYVGENEPRDAARERIAAGLARVTEIADAAHGTRFWKLGKPRERRPYERKP